MSDELLRRLLQQADATAGPPPRIGDHLAARVRGRVLRRRRVAFRLSAAAAIVLAAGVTVLMSYSPTRRGPLAGAGIARSEPVATPHGDVRAELARLDREAEIRIAVARRTAEILTQRRLAESRTLQQPAIADPVADAQREVEQAAYTLVSQADRMCRDMNLCATAVVNYQRVVELFPETPWATVARQRLEEIKNKGEIS
jgi:hypothetical protein